MDILLNFIKPLPHYYYYYLFWKKINCILSNGSIPKLWNEAKINTILKRHATLPALYWPIALLNQDYKIVTGIIAHRLNKIITNYINVEQYGFI